MGYIGNTPAEKYITLSKQTFTPDSSTVAFTLDNPVANENELAVFINNVRQEPGSGKAYTATGNTLTMSEAPTSGHAMYAIYLGKTMATNTPAVGSVTNDMLAGSINESKLLGSIPNSKLANSSITLNGSAVSLGGSATVGITEADQWRVTAGATANQDPISSNWERVDTDGFNYIGTGMTESSGTFTFPSTGFWLIRAQGSGYVSSANSQAIRFIIKTTTNNSTYSEASHGANGAYNFGSGLNTEVSTYCEFLFDVTNITTHKVRLAFVAGQGHEGFTGNTDQTRTGLTFLRIGDT